ncbi:MAG TPA: RodZ domain-containing protein [Dokdonella sp.]
MRAVQASEENEPERAEAATDGAQHGDGSQALPFGRRLRLARERLGLGAGDVSARLKLPANLIARLENDDYGGVSQGVFLRGYLISYARLVGLSEDEAARVAAAHTQAAPLVATGTIPRSRYLFDRYSGSATYLILTAIIVVPAVWVATHGGLEQNLARTTPLDPPAGVAAAERGGEAGTVDVQSPSAPATDLADAASAPKAPDALSPQVDQPPVVASMTPFAAASSPPAPPVPTPTPSVGSGAHVLSLKLSQQSWVEITAADGRKLEYATLAAGSQRDYRSDGPVSVRLGNAQGAELRGDGSVVDLAPFQRGNVAHVRLFGVDGAAASRIDSQ